MTPRKIKMVEVRENKDRFNGFLKMTAQPDKPYRFLLPGAVSLSGFWLKGVVSAQWMDKTTS